MFIEEIEEKERTLGDKFEEFGKKLGKLCDLGFDILGDKKMGEKERSEFIDILANIKGAKMAAYKIMENYSDVKKEDREKIDKKADEFVEGHILVFLHALLEVVDHLERGIHAHIGLHEGFLDRIEGVVIDP